MKKQTYKIGEKYKVIEDSYDVFKSGEIVTLIDDADSAVPKFRNEKGIKDWLSINEVKSLVSPKKVIKPSVKRVKPQERYFHVAFHIQHNVYSLTAYKSNGDYKSFVFNTKNRLIKWIEKNI